MTPVRPRRAIRFGMAMRPLTISASAQMDSSFRKAADARMTRKRTL